MIRRDPWNTQQLPGVSLRGCLFMERVPSTPRIIATPCVCVCTPRTCTRRSVPNSCLFNTNTESNHDSQPHDRVLQRCTAGPELGQTLLSKGRPGPPARPAMCSTVPTRPTTIPCAHDGICHSAYRHLPRAATTQNNTKMSFWARNVIPTWALPAAATLYLLPYCLTMGSGQ